MAWLAEGLHGVVFVDPATNPVDALQPWMKVFGVNPQNFQTSLPGQPMTATASGLINRFQVILSSQPGRIEFAFSNPQSKSGEISGISEFESALDFLCSCVAKLEGELSPNRLAIVANLVRQAATAEDAVKLFFDDTKLTGLPSNASDLQLAFNAPKDFLEIGNEQNRLSRWGTGVQQLYTVQITSDSSAPMMSVIQVHAETWTIDVNTKVIDLSSLETTMVDMFKSLAEEVKRMKAGGYDYIVG